MRSHWSRSASNSPWWASMYWRGGVMSLTLASGLRWTSPRSRRRFARDEAAQALGVEQVDRRDGLVAADVVERRADARQLGAAQCGPGEPVRGQLDGGRVSLGARWPRARLPVDDGVPLWAGLRLGEDGVHPATHDSALDCHLERHLDLDRSAIGPGAGLERGTQRRDVGIVGGFVGGTGQ